MRSSNHTSKIMIHLLIALSPIILFAFFKNGIVPYIKGYTNFFGCIKPLLMVIIGGLSSILTEYLYAKFILKVNGLEYVRKSYSIFPGIFLALVLPLNATYFMVIFGAVVASFLGKLIYGGFGKNIFNPALIGTLFVLTCYGSVISGNGGYLNAFEIDTISSATPLGNIMANNYVNNVSSVINTYGGLQNFLIGNIPGALGETCKVLILFSLIYLIVNKVIKWRIPICYVTTFAVLTGITCLIKDLSIEYFFFQLLSGGLLFGATFMATDPVTSPVTQSGQVIYGISLGLLTFIFRFFTSYPEGVLTSILTMNLLVFIIDKISYKYNAKLIVNIIIIFVIILGIIFGSIVGSSDNKVSCDIVDAVSSDNVVKYYINENGFNGLIKTEVVFKGGRMTDINVLSHSESYFDQIENSNYIDTLIMNQENIDEVDTISGVTYSSRALRNIAKCALDRYGESR